ncbi:MAG TPA: lantibiotic dehydratase [Streptosporangiaceae bacterium]|nr:lantibiotic dehydratase [Streptosporangiaceae bacterium]
MTSDRGDSHLVPLPGSGWAVWRDAQLRSAGFPAAGLDRFSAPECAATADAFLDARAGRAELEAAHAAAVARESRVVAEIAADPLFREALSWQNPGAAARIAMQAPAGQSAWQRRNRSKARDNLVTRYWQRYCAKNDTIGFFGPTTWVSLDPHAPAVRASHGDRLVRARTVYFEYWALEAFASHLAADPLIRPWLPVGLWPHVTVAGREVLMPGRDPLPLTGAEADLLARCDGLTSAAAVAGYPEHAPALAVLDGLAARGVIWWGVDMPQNPGAEKVLRATLTAIADQPARERALAWLARLDTARDAVSGAAGDPDSLAPALGRLDAEFTSITGAAAERKHGQMYAGRRICYEETVRDLEVTFGGPVLDAMAGPFGRVLLPAARWLSAALADACTQAFRKLYAELGGFAAAGIPLHRFWTAALPLLTDRGPVVSGVAGEFGARWATLFGLDQLPPEARRVTLTSAELAGPAAELFAAPRPAWAGARIHSPDLQICAASVTELARGEFTIVLGEMHAMWPTLDNASVADRHPEPARLRAAAAADIGPQIVPFYASWCPQFTPRMASVRSDDYQLAFTPEAGADPARLLPSMTITVTEQDGELIAAAGDGRRWPLLAIFAMPIAWSGTDLFKLARPGRHVPRITIDRLVVVRESWRTTVAEAWPTRSGGLPEYLAARRLRLALGLPDRLFVKISAEVKPVYVDLTSPRSVSALATMLRAARERAGAQTEVAMTELLPGPDQAWLPGPGGQRYFSELRVQVRDPVPADGLDRMEDR